MDTTHWDETPVGACTRDPERWTTSADEDAKAICRACPRRWLCAREACELPRAEGLWAGIVHPGRRARTHVCPAAAALAGRTQRSPGAGPPLYAESA